MLNEFREHADDATMRSHQPSSRRSRITAKRRKKKRDEWNNETEEEKEEEKASGKMRWSEVKPQQRRSLREEHKKETQKTWQFLAWQHTTTSPSVAQNDHHHHQHDHHEHHHNDRACAQSLCPFPHPTSHIPHSPFPLLCFLPHRATAVIVTLFSLIKDNVEDFTRVRSIEGVRYSRTLSNLLYFSSGVILLSIVSSNRLSSWSIDSTYHWIVYKFQAKLIFLKSYSNSHWFDLALLLCWHCATVILWRKHDVFCWLCLVWECSIKIKCIVNFCLLYWNLELWNIRRFSVVLLYTYLTALLQDCGTSIDLLLNCYTHIQ